MKNSEVKLSKLNLPGDLKHLSYAQCNLLCRDIRKTILQTVMKSGGHLSSNLGTVELTVALHRVFDSPYDKLVWDVGHQAYTHKLLTGRYENFDTLRKKDGISGYVRPSESEHDAFISGHSSTSISAALGLAEAMRLNGDTVHRAVAVIGDGAFTGGMAYEGLNNAGKSNENIIVILNHNDMSISKNVGAFAKYLTSIRGNQKYLDTKKAVEELLDSTPVIGSPLKNVLISSKSTLKMLLYHSTMFEDMGFVYLGPVDGHNIAELEKTLETAKRINKPVFIHVNTVKGKGFRPAEENPGAFHSIPSCGYNINNPDNSSQNTFSDNFGKYLAALAMKDKNICAITAAMKYGTGLQYFASNYPERFFDVGIAEQHAVTFAAGLASGGKVPVFAVYSSFLQRCYDQLVHDVAIEKTHVVLAVDRAGIVANDGETHQGMFDIPMLKAIPGTTIYSPSNFDEQRKCLKKAIYETPGLAVVRYPKGGEDFGYCGSQYDTDNYYHFKSGSSSCLAISFGRLFNRLYDASRSSALNGFDMIKLVKIFPVDDEVIEAAMKYYSIVIFEESSKSGGIGEYLTVKLMEKGYKGRVKVCAIEEFVPQSGVVEALRCYRLDKRSMLGTIKDMENLI